MRDGSRSAWSPSAIARHRTAPTARFLAKPGELTFAAKDKLFDKIKPKGQAPIAAALSDAANAQVKDQSLDIVLIADGGDTCDADICSTAAAMKEKPKGAAHPCGRLQQQGR